MRAEITHTTLLWGPPRVNPTPLNASTIVYFHWPTLDPNQKWFTITLNQNLDHYWPMILWYHRVWLLFRLTIIMCHIRTYINCGLQVQHKRFYQNASDHIIHASKINQLEIQNEFWLYMLMKDYKIQYNKIVNHIHNKWKIYIKSKCMVVYIGNLGHLQQKSHFESSHPKFVVSSAR